MQTSTPTAQFWNGDFKRNRALTGAISQCVKQENRCAQLFASLALFALTAIVPHESTANILSTPTPSYLANTNLISFSDPDEALIDAISGSGLTLQFTSAMRASTVGNNWASWGSPPDTESAVPRVLWSGLDDDFMPVTSMTLLLSHAVSIFGFEAEPGPTEFHALEVSFFAKGILLERITRSVNGDAGARLFAAQAPPGELFDAVTVTSDVDWAVGQFRFATDIPTPSTFSTLLIGLFALLVLFTTRRN